MWPCRRVAAVKALEVVAAAACVAADASLAVFGAAIGLALIDVRAGSAGEALGRDAGHAGEASDCTLMSDISMARQRSGGCPTRPPAVDDVGHQHAPL